MAFLTHNTEALSLRLSNPFWTQVLDRWKIIQSNLYSTPTNLIHTNICNSKSTNFPLSIGICKSTCHTAPKFQHYQ